MAKIQYEDPIRDKEVEQARRLFNHLDKKVKTLVKELSDSGDYSDKEKNKLLFGINRIFTEYNEEMNKHIKGTFKKEYTKALYHATESINRMGLYDLKYETTKESVRTLTKAMDDTMLDLRACIRTALGNSYNNIDNMLETVNQRILDGYLSGANRTKVINGLMNDFSKNGYTAFVTKDGKQLPLDFYTETVVRTKRKQVVNHANLDRYVDAGIKTFKISGRSPTCWKCAIYRERVFTIDPSDKRFTYLDVYETFPVHPNCQCIINPYVIDTKSEDELKEDMKQSKQFNPNVDTRTVNQRDAYTKQQKAQRIARQDAKDYDRMKLVLGDKAPKSIGGFRNIKRNNPKKYNELMSTMRKDPYYKELISIPKERLKGAPEHVIDAYVQSKQIKETVEVVETVVKEEIKAPKHITPLPAPRVKFNTGGINKHNVTEKMNDVIQDRLKQSTHLNGYNEYATIFKLQEEDGLNLINKSNNGAYYYPHHIKNNRHIQMPLGPRTMKQERLTSFGKVNNDKIDTFYHEFSHHLDHTIIGHSKKVKEQYKKLGKPDSKRNMLASQFYEIDGKILGDVVADDFKEFKKLSVEKFKNEWKKKPIFFEKIDFIARRTRDLSKDTEEILDDIKAGIVDSDEIQNLLTFYHIQEVAESYGQGSLYDMFNGSTKNANRFSFSHSDDYWKRKVFRENEGLSMEAFAEISEMYNRPELYDIYKKVLPNALERYFKMLKEFSEGL